jgi:hypothetical protein
MKEDWRDIAVAAALSWLIVAACMLMVRWVVS